MRKFTPIFFKWVKLSKFKTLYKKLSKFMHKYESYVTLLNIILRHCAVILLRQFHIIAFELDTKGFFRLGQGFIGIVLTAFV
jgi:hypothetical protein